MSRSATIRVHVEVHAERINQGEGRWNRTPMTALKRSGLTEKTQVQESHTEGERKKAPDQKSLSPKKKE